MVDLNNISVERPVLITGPTGCGKSALALELAARHGGTIINADAMQVFSNWRILTARPSPQDQATASHHLYGQLERSASITGSIIAEDTQAIGRQVQAKIDGLDLPPGRSL